MVKLYFIIFILIINLSTFSQDFDYFFNSGSSGIEFSYPNTIYSKISLPSIYLIENISNLGLVYKTLSINFTDLEHDILTVYTSANLFWSLVDQPVGKNNSLLIGSYINLELTNQLDLTAKIGVLYHHFLPKKYNLISKMKIRAVDIESGYNLTKNFFYASIDIDFLVLLAFFISESSIIF